MPTERPATKDGRRWACKYVSSSLADELHSSRLCRQDAIDAIACLL
jgi:hypothetical protein